MKNGEEIPNVTECNHLGNILSTISNISIVDHAVNNMFIIYIKERKGSIVTQTYQIITKHIQHRNKFTIYYIHDYSHTQIHIIQPFTHNKKNMTYIYYITPDRLT